MAEIIEKGYHREYLGRCEHCKTLTEWEAKEVYRWSACVEGTGFFHCPLGCGLVRGYELVPVPQWKVRMRQFIRAIIRKTREDLWQNRKSE